MTRRERALAAKLDAARASMAIIADMLRGIAARQDEHAHRDGKAARASGGTLTEAASLSPARNMLLACTADTVARSKATAADLDRAVEALERLAAALRSE